MFYLSKSIIFMGLIVEIEVQWSNQYFFFSAKDQINAYLH